MKKMIIICVVITFSSCTHKHKGKLVKDSEGNYYLLKAMAVNNEAYYLDKVDTTEMRLLR